VNTMVMEILVLRPGARAEHRRLRSRLVWVSSGNPTGIPGLIHDGDDVVGYDIY
jgi:hypothetical protein